jgi:hypothetical protein
MAAQRTVTFSMSNHCVAFVGRENSVLTVSQSKVAAAFLGMALAMPPR